MCLINYKGGRWASTLKAAEKGRTLVLSCAEAEAADPALAALTRKVSLASDEKLGPFQIRVDIRTTDGRDLSHFIPSQKGDHLNPLSWDELVVKFSANALAALPKANVDKLVPMLHKIEDVKDVAELTRLCRP